MRKLSRDFLRWRWAPFVALSSGSLIFAALMLWLIPSQLDPSAPATATRVPAPAVQTEAEPGRSKDSSWLPAPAVIPAGEAAAAPASNPLPGADARALPADNPFAAQQAATHAREIRRRGRPVLKLELAPSVAAPDTNPADF